MSFIPKVEKWLEDARRRKAAAAEGSATEREETRNVKMYEELLESLHARHPRPKMREPGEDEE